MNIEIIKDLTDRLISYEKQIDEAGRKLADAIYEVRVMEEKVELGVKDIALLKEAIKKEANKE